MQAGRGEEGSPVYTYMQWLSEVLVGQSSACMLWHPSVLPDRALGGGQHPIDAIVHSQSRGPGRVVQSTHTSSLVGLPEHLHRAPACTIQVEGECKHWHSAASLIRESSLRSQSAIALPTDLH
uniref:Uncharacterized protein n=1 Tax=Rousettus aegyptiacus TaxID=9407 RepID=A0A7J8KAW3_ROUAE|nr:hypothetical protein HJG63_007873 [Rousettus aegyptiacus]